MVALVTLAVLAAPDMATADVDSKIPADSTLKPGQTFTYTSSESMLGSGELIYNPSQCRTHPAYSQTCDVFRIVLDRDLAPGALNFAFFSLEFEQVRPPAVAVGVAGLNPPPVNDLNVYVWDEVGHYLGADKATNPDDVAPGGNGFGSPERGGFTANKRAYDIVVQAMTGVSNGYALRVTFSNERFTNPFESLDELSMSTPPPETPPAFSGSDTFTPPFSDGLPDSLALAPLPATGALADRDIANIGFGITEQLGAVPIDLGGGQRRDVVAVGSAPSAILLLLALIVLPLVAAGGATFWLRRRRASLLA